MHDEVSGNHEHGMHHMSQACGCDDGWIIGAATSGIWLWPWRGGRVKAVAQQLSCCGCRIRYSVGAPNFEGQFEAIGTQERREAALFRSYTAHCETLSVGRVRRMSVGRERVAPRW
jgi:hypothetical protein